MPGPQTIETGYAPIKAWVEGVPVEDAARRQLLNIAALPFIHSHVAVMPDVHLGKGATVGSVIATKGGDRAGGGRRRHRLRHDGGAHDAHGRRPAGQPRQAAARHRGRRPARRHRPKGGWKDGVPNAVGAPVRRERPGRRPEGARGQASADPRRAERHAPGLARRRQPLHRGLPRRGGARLGDAALGLARHRQPHRHATSSPGRARRWTGASSRVRCRTGTSPGWRKASRCSTTTSRRSPGRRTSRATTAR